MTRARILKPATPPTQPSGPQTNSARNLPWLPDSPARPARRARMPLGTGFIRQAAPALDALRRTVAAGLAGAKQAAAVLSHKAQAVAPAHPAPAAKGAPRSVQAPNTLRKRAALLLAIITVPAMAAPRDFTLFSSPEPAPLAPDPLALAAAQALPFERPGMSFPGSAFFFLDDPPAGALVALPTADPLDTGAEAGRELGEFIAVGPAARPFFSAGAGLSHTRAQDCLAQAVWYEAASESEAGQRAVAQVVLNRVAHPSWPASVCGVVYQGAERSTGCQFTFTCDGSLARRPAGASWARAQRIAAAALAGEVYAPVGHATHYHTLWVDPYWARTLDHVGTIGAHRFYRNRGAGGEKSAFTMAYAGFEPAVRGRTAVTAPSETFADSAAAPVVPSIVRPFENSGRLIGETGPASSTERSAAKRKGKGKGNAKGSAVPTDNALQRSGEVLPEFANAGQWKVDPATVK